ncbi:MAG: hypothetical protein ICV85_11645 [Tolypothrix sp. T3-bin4]|nr:hypothetical protein [Tolypothrix sp. T3-bin4]
MKIQLRVLIAAISITLASPSIAATVVEGHPVSTSEQQLIAQAGSRLSSLVGQYVVFGTGVDGQKYNGVVWIERNELEPETVKIGWSLNEPRYRGRLSSYTGTGKLAADGRLVATYAGTTTGEQTFTIKSDGSLEATYTDSNGTGSERLIPVESLAPAQ